MKICLISNLYPPYARGGAEQVVKNTVEGLVARGHEVAVITARPLFAGNATKQANGGGARDSSGRPVGPQNDNRDGTPTKDARSDATPRIYCFFPLNLFFYGNDFKYPFWLRFFWHLFDVFNFHSYWRVRQILKKEKPDVVHTHNLKGLGYLIPLAIRGLGLRHVHTLHDVQLVEPSGIIIKGGENQWPYNFFLRSWYEKICRVLFGSPEVVISPSNFLLEFYESRGFFPHSRKVVVPNPVISQMNAAVSDSRWIPASAGMTAMGGNDSEGRDFSFLYLGQIEDHKGVLLLIRAFKRLHDEMLKPAPCPLPLAYRQAGSEESIDPSAPLRQSADGGGLRMTTKMTLHIVGAGAKLAEAQKLAAACPQIIFHGKIDRAQLPQIFSQTDMAIVPSLCYENSPTVIFESFSFGAPVLASSIEGVAELIKNGANGLTFEAGNEADLIEKMRWCVEHPTDIAAMRPAALKSIEGRGLDSYLDKLLNLCYNI